MKICCTADFHGHLPTIPDGIDLLLIGGDIGPHPARNLRLQAAWLGGTFRRWLEPIAARCPVVAVAGNHDFIFQDARHLVPNDLPWTYLQDESTEVAGFRVHGSPWQPVFMDWAFNATELELCRRWSLIPTGTDILLLHGPPFGVGDLEPYGKTHTGSRGLRGWIEAVKPKLVCCGHIHDGYGVYDVIDGTVVVNAAHVDEDYEPANEPVVIEL
jgi:Icc-related predicted phosphoesterase